MNNIEFYTDGAYSSVRDTGGVGIIEIINDVKVFEYSKSYKHTTNNRMELLAVLIVLQSLIKHHITDTSITIYSDSMYVIGCATLNWKRKKNIDMWDKYDLLYKEVLNNNNVIIFKHVKGHTDSKYNNQCDKLATTATL